MMGLFKCKHPAEMLHVRSGETVGPMNDECNEHLCNDEYEKVTYNLYCLKCGHDVKVSYARCKFTIEEMIKRYKDKL